MALSTIQNNSLADTALHGYRNLVINGAMQVSQRNDVSNVTVSGSNYYEYHSTDRWKTGLANMDGLVFSCEQSTDAPAGLNFSRKYTIHTAKANAVDQYFDTWTRLERHSYSGVGIGTSAAKNLTLSFWVKSSETGQFGGIHLVYPTAGGAYSVNFTYTINAANTWEYKTVLLPTSSLTAATFYMAPSSDAGDYIAFHMNSGTDYDGGTGSTSSYKSYSGSDWAVGHQVDITTVTNATWAITGVQLEIGDMATPFEHRLYADELRRCERYYQQWTAGGTTPYLATGRNHSSTVSIMSLTYRTEMRGRPALYISSASDIKVYDGNDRTCTGIVLNGNALNTCGFSVNGLSSGVGNNYVAQAYFMNGYFALDAEL